jgi:hypothetical protein
MGIWKCTILTKTKFWAINMAIKKSVEQGRVKTLFLHNSTVFKIYHTFTSISINLSYLIFGAIYLTWWHKYWIHVAVSTMINNHGNLLHFVATTYEEMGSDKNQFIILNMYPLQLMFTIMNHLIASLSQSLHHGVS